MIKELHTKRFHLTEEGYLWVYDYKLARKLNKYFKKYDKGRYVFQNGENAMFRLRGDHCQIEYNYILSRFLAPKSTQKSLWPS